MSEIGLRLLLIERAWEDQHENTRSYIKEWHTEMVPLLESYAALYEAELTADQIQTIFQNAEQYAADSGQYLTRLGKVGKSAKLSADAIKKLNDKVNELARKAQSTTPVENFDQAFEKAKSQLSSKMGGDSSRIISAANKLGKLAADNPGKSTFLIALLVTASTVAGGPGGAAAVGFLLRSGRDILAGEKLSTALGRATKVGALGALAGASIEAISNAFPGAPVSEIQVSNNGSVELPDRYTINGEEVSASEYQQWKEDNPIFSDRELREFDRLAQQGETINRMAEQMGVDNAGNNNAKMIGGVPVEINGQPVPPELYTEEQKQSLSAARQARAAMGISDSINYELLLAKRLAGVALTESEQQLVNEIGWNDIKKASASVAQKAKQTGKTVGRELGQKITARKLQSQWKRAGSPTDSAEIATILALAGIDVKGIDAVAQATGIELPYELPYTDTDQSQTDSNSSADDETPAPSTQQSPERQRLERIKRARASAELDDVKSDTEKADSELEQPKPKPEQLTFPGTDVDFKSGWVNADDLTAADPKVASVLDKIASGIDPRELSMQELLAARRKLKISKPQATTESLRAYINRALGL